MKLIKNEWKKLFKNPILILVLVVIMLIPSMYAGLFLSSMWDPYGDLDMLPVAVVNEDEAVEFNGTVLHIGDTLVDNLAQSGSLDFHFVNREEAEQGLTDGNYYMIITIPEDFSYRASTALDYEPERMQLLYETNPATNYVATKLSQSAMNKIQMSLQESVTESYIEALMNNINTIGDGMVEAADGTSQILNGENQVVDGVAALHDGTNTLREGANSLNNGARDLSNGANVLADGATTLSNGANALHSGSTTLQSGINNYLQGTVDLRDGISSLYDSAPTLVDGVNQVNDGAATLVQGQNQIINGFSADDGALNGAAALASGAATLDSLVQNAETNPLITLSDEQIAAISSGASSQATASITSDNQIVQLVAAGLMYQSATSGAPIDQETAIASATTYVGQLASTVASSTAASTATQVVGGINQALPSTLGVYTSQLNTGATALNTGINQLYQGSLQIQSGLNTLSTGTGALASGADLLSTGVSQLNTGANTLVSNNESITTGVSSLVDGASSLNDGASALMDGANTLADGTNTLYSGTLDLSTGAVSLDDGVGELENALPELVDGTTELYTSLNNGATEIQDTNLNEANSEMMASPVETIETQITTVENNGTAMAAYMMSVGLWVACLAFCLMYPLTEHDKLKNGFAWWASKASVLFPIAVIQAVVLVLVLKHFLGFNPVDMKGTMAVAILSSVAFMAIMYYFNALIGKVGSFIMLVFMVFQLAGSAGTYPIELSGPLAQALHSLVPFTYTVNAFRSAIGGGADYTISIIVLVGIIVVFTVLTLWMFQGRSLLEKHDKNNVHDLLEVKGLA